LYFSKISTCIENEAIAGILLKKLHVQNDSHRILINGDDKKYIKENKFLNNEKKYDMSSLRDDYKLIDFKNLKLCYDLNSFKFIDDHVI